MGDHHRCVVVALDLNLDWLDQSAVCVKRKSDAAAAAAAVDRHCIKLSWHNDRLNYE